MPNIFDGFNKAQDKDIINQIVLLKTITFSNLLKVEGRKTLKSTTSAINFITGIFTNKLKIEEPIPKTIEDIMREETIKIQDFSRDKLNLILKRELQEKVKNKTTIQSSDDELSIAIVDKASKGFKDIEDYWISEQKIDMIKQNFIGRMICSIQNKMNKQTRWEREKTEQEIQRSLDNLSIEDQEKIKNILKVNKLTGETVYNILTTTAASTLALNLFGQFGGYIFLTTIMHGLFTTLLGITLPFAAYTTATSALSIITGPIGILGVLGFSIYKLNKGNNKIEQEVLAQSVAMAAFFYGNKPMTPRLEILPSWIPEEDKESLAKEKEQNEIIKSLLKKVDNYKKENEEISFKLEEANKDIREKKMALDLARKNKEKYIENIHQLQEKLMNEQLLSEQKYNEKLNNEIDYYNKLFDEAANNELKLVSRIEKLEKEKNLLDIEKKEAINKQKEYEQLFDKKAEKVIQCIYDSWKIHFTKFIYDKKFLKEVAKYSYDIRLELEKVLKVLHDAKDPKALSRGNMHNGDCHVAVTLAYRLSYIVNADNTITLKYFHHHKLQDRRY